MFKLIDATTTQKTSVYSKVSDNCLLVLPHWKSGGTKPNFASFSLANHVLYPLLLESRRRPCLQKMASV